MADVHPVGKSADTTMENLDSLFDAAKAGDQQAALRWLKLGKRQGDRFVRDRITALYPAVESQAGAFVRFLLENCYYNEAFNLAERAYFASKDYSATVLFLSTALATGLARRAVDSVTSLQGEDLRLLHARCLVQAGRTDDALVVLSDLAPSAAARFTLGWLQKDSDTARSEALVASLRADQALIEVEVDSPASFSDAVIAAARREDLAAIKVLIEAFQAGEEPAVTAPTELLKLDARSADHWSLIRELGLSPHLVYLNAPDSEDLEAIDFDGSARLSRLTPSPNEYFYGAHGVPMERGPWRPAAMQRRMCTDRAARAFSPWTGHSLTSRRSIVVGADVAYEFRCRHTFYLLSMGWQARREALFIPALNCVVLLNRLVSDQHLETIVAGVASPPPSEPSSGAARMALIVGVNANMGHHYHNELSALYRLERDGLLSSFDDLIIGPHDYYDIESLFGANFEKVTRHSDISGLAEHVERENLFAVRMTDVAAYSGLGDRLIEAARHRTTPRSRSLAREVEGRVTILLTVRTARRAWRGQVEGAISLIRAVRAFYPDVLFVLDGMTQTEADSVSEQRLIAADKSVAASISLRANAEAQREIVKIIVGWMAWEKISLLPRLSLAITPKGNGHLPNLAWIGNVPSIVHGNSYDIKDALWETHWREDAIPPVIIDRDMTIDVMREATAAPAIHTQHLIEYDISIDGLIGATLQRLSEIVRR